MEELQIDIFGNLVPVEHAVSRHPKETIKSRYRRMYGYDESHRCADCVHLVKTVANRTFYKCELIGLSASEATDIRLKDPACKRWEKAEECKEL